MVTFITENQRQIRLQVRSSTALNLPSLVQLHVTIQRTVETKLDEEILMPAALTGIHPLV